MAQPSVAQYFNTRKRAAVDDAFATKSRKVQIIDKKNSELCEPCIVPVFKSRAVEKVEPVTVTNYSARRKLLKATLSAAKAKISETNHQSTLDKFMSSNVNVEKDEKAAPEVEQKLEAKIVKQTAEVSDKKTDEATKVSSKPDLSFDGIKQKLTRSEKLAELKASLLRFKQADSRLKEAEAKTQESPEVKKLKGFKSIEFEVNLSPQKVQSPEKRYLSPKKNISPRKNLFSPVKEASSCRKALLYESKEKTSLKLPKEYRYLAEVFRSIDTVCQLMHNRKETITFRRLKPAVEELLRRNLYEKHLAQIKNIYPEAFDFQLKKLKVFGVGSKKEQWELVIVPIVDDTMTSEILLERRRHLFNSLIEKVKLYHQEFLRSLSPPLEIPLEKITRWHPEFDLENVPEIEQFNLPKAPTENKIATGREILEKAKLLMGVNPRLDSALERLKTDEEAIKPEVKIEENPVLKGIPKALLEKVRQKQAAKALELMTRSSSKEKEIEMYSRLPEMIRFARNLFVTEKKSVLTLEVVLEKFNHSFSRNLSKQVLEEHLRVVAKEFPDLIVFHNIRNVTYVKLHKNVDVNTVISELEAKIKEKGLA